MEKLLLIISMLLLMAELCKYRMHTVCSSITPILITNARNVNEANDPFAKIAKPFFYLKLIVAVVITLHTSINF